MVERLVFSLGKSRPFFASFWAPPTYEEPAILASMVVRRLANDNEAGTIPSEADWDERVTYPLNRQGWHLAPQSPPDQTKTDRSPTPSILDARFPHREAASKRSPDSPSRLQLISLGDLLKEPEEAIQSIVDRMLPVGGISILGAKPKVGKSTLSRNLAFAIGRGEPFLGREAIQGTVLYLALEEKRSEVQRHFARMGAQDEPIYLHMKGAPEQVLDEIARAITIYRPILVIIDPLLKCVRVRDANDYAEMTRAMEPLIELARSTGCHILLVHHLGKGDRSGGDGLLGSTAIFGAVDTALIMKRTEQGRTIASVQRYGEDLPETILTFDPNTGRVAPVGTVADHQLGEMAKEVLTAIGEEELTELVIRDRIGGDRSQVSKALRQQVKAGVITRIGGGKKGDPYRYRRSAPSTEEDLWKTDYL